MPALLASLLAAHPPAADTLAVWWAATATDRATGTTTIDRALLGGASADRLGFAFAAGYAEALHALASATRALATADVAAPATHLALAGLLDLAAAIVTAVEAAWAPLAGDEHARWQRDRPLLRVASAARTARRDTARAALLTPA